ncbi:MAG: LamG-like jellyroll fold domain-containing protein, partial [Flavobacteriales bacterium]
MRYFYALLLTFFSFQFFSQIPNYVPTNGLVGWWPFTGNANDLSVNGNNGTVNGATLTTDRFGSPNCAYIFNGNSNIVVPYNQNQTIIGAGTWSLWVNASLFPNNGNQSHLISKYNSITNLREFVMEFDASTIKHNINDGTNWHTVSNGTSTQINQWVNVIAVYDKLITPSLKLYVNGALINTSNTFNGNLINNNLPIVFSNLTGVGVVPFQGKLDDIGIWNRALSQQEITALYTSTAGTVASLNCNSFTQNGNLYSGQAANNVSLSVPYTGGNAGFYAGQNVSSTGVTGLTATLTSGTLANGSGTLSYTITGTPSGVGNATFAINIGGQSCNLVVPITALSGQYPANSVFCANGPTAIVDVTNPTTGKTWMDRNLGASQVATSSTDQNAYGDLYQWGRRADGHQCRTSATTSTLSSIDQPAHGNFIIAPNAPNDWRSPQNNNLWQGVNGVNNPCPSGYRIPTEQELDAERLSWSSNNSLGAYLSILKLTAPGSRFYGDAVLYDVGIIGQYWSRNSLGNTGRYLYFNTSISNINSYGKADGFSVRCIKETIGSVGSINCNSFTQSGNLYSGQAASNVSINVPYAGGNGGYYAGQNASSTGVTGLTATLTSGTLVNGSGTLSYTITGTPSGVGNATFALSVG